MAKTKKSKSTEKENPVLQFSVMCDGLAQEPSGKFAMLGVFDMFFTNVTIPQFAIINRFVYGKGKFKSKIIIKSPDLATNINETKANEFLLDKETSIANVVFGFVNLRFETPGVYWVEVHLDSKVIMTYPFQVVERK